MRRLAVLLAACAALSCDSSVSGLTGITPNQLPATRLVILSQPTSESVATNINPVIQVAVQSATGQTITTSGAEISAVLTPNTGTAGAVLSGANPVAAQNGIAVFTDLRVDRTGTAYTLTFTSGTLTAAISVPFDIVP